MHHVPANKYDEPLHLETQDPKTFTYQPLDFSQLREAQPASNTPLLQWPDLLCEFENSDRHSAGTLESLAERPDPSKCFEFGIQYFDHTSDIPKQAFENTSTSVAASQMRNALNNLADTVTNDEDKKVRKKLTHAEKSY